MLTRDKSTTVKRYDVDWGDPSYPEIVSFECNRDIPNRARPGYKTLAEARDEVIRHFQYQIDHARRRIADARALRAGDVEHDGT